MINDVKTVQSYFVYQYTFLDDLSFILDPEKVMTQILGYDSDKEGLNRTIEEIRSLFSAHGWEGDGKIGILWFPPFVGVGPEDTYGHYVWHVKQRNNGVSWIASSRPLEFDRLKTQNQPFPKEGYRTLIAQGIIEGDVNGITKALVFERDRLSEELRQISRLSYPKELYTQISDKILAYTQNHLVYIVTDFLHDCYLRMLIHVLSHGNPAKLQLERGKARFDLEKHYPESNDLGVDVEASRWLSLQLLISDIWHSYMFEPFPDKLRRIVRAVDYYLDPQVRHTMLKHIVIRNCIQHHEWALSADSLRILGADSIEIQTCKGLVRVEKWHRITLAPEELNDLISTLITFAKDFATHVHKRIPMPTYVVRE